MICLHCKGRGLCGRANCPILHRLRAEARLPPLGCHLMGPSPPEVLVGHRGYPEVMAGPVISLSEISSPQADIRVEDIIAFRSRAVTSLAPVSVSSASFPDQVLQKAQELAMSSMPVDMEVTFRRPPKGSIRFDGVLRPAGPTGPLEKISITSNPVVPRRVDQLVEDRDVTAQRAVLELQRAEIGQEHISRLLSLGLLGKDRRLVPTRWAITASDDMLGRVLKEKVAEMPVISHHLLYSGEFLGNHLEIVLMPRPLFFELVEIWLPGSAWSPQDILIGVDGEGSRVKKDYSPLAGGYYAARLGVLEGMSNLGRQAGVLAVREINEGYWAPLGVWVVREAVRLAMASAGKRYSTLGEALEDMQMSIKTPLNRWKNQCQAIRSGQTTLAGFFESSGSNAWIL